LLLLLGAPSTSVCCLQPCEMRGQLKVISGHAFRSS
jgi:hypothetical protein